MPDIQDPVGLWVLQTRYEPDEGRATGSSLGACIRMRYEVGQIVASMGPGYWLLRMRAVNGPPPLRVVSCEEMSGGGTEEEINTDLFATEEELDAWLEWRKNSASTGPKIVPMR